MKKYISLVLFFCLLAQVQGIAQTSSEKKTYHKFGLHASPTASLGMGYKYVSGKHQGQITLLPLTFSTDNFAQNNTRVFFNATAMNYFFKISDQRAFDILVFGGLSHWYYSRSYDQSFDVWVNGTTTTNTERITNSEQRMNASLGFAFEVGTSERFKINGQIAYAAYNFTGELTIANILGIGLEFALNFSL